MPKRLDRQKCFLFVCDVQSNFAEESYNYQGVLMIAKAMIQSAKLLDIPIIVTKHRKKAESHIIPEIEKLLIGNKYPTVVKEKFSMFVPEIEQVLFENPERTQIILLGLEAHVCVLQTCYDLLEKGFDVWILADGVSSISSFERSIGLKGLQKSGAEITSFQTVVFELLKYSYDQKFQQLCQIMRKVKDEKTIDHL